MDIGSFFNCLFIFSLQGSEIFTVVAKDGDVGNPNQIEYAFDDGKFLKVHPNQNITLL